MRRLTWIGMISLLWLITACGDDSVQVQVVSVASIPTLIPTPSAVVPLPPTAPPPIQLPSPTSQPTRMTTSEVPTSIPPTVTPIALGEVVIAVKPIPAGMPIPPEAVQVVPWPADALPYTPITQLDEVINEVALVDIGCNEPILPDAIAFREVGSGFTPLPGACPAREPNAGTVNVVIAVADLPIGSMIEPNDVTLRVWPAGALPPGHYRSLSEVIGTTVTTDVRREQPLTAQRVVSE